jgi:D-beta-D-heptose 7-phosphate kinase/D-beta-D-heptose 1-phosphate adenosyltransferase
MLAGALVAGADLIDAARLANIAGGLEVEKFGCVPITGDEILAELRLEDRRRSGKLRTVEELVSELKLRRDRGETAVFTNGCFDLLHVGHIDFLQRCREEGSLLVVAINSDASVRCLNKGGSRPINPEEDRAHVLGALACVDYVVIFDEPDPERIIRQIRPDILAKGEDWAAKGVVGREFVESYGGKVKLLPLLEGYSSTFIIERIQASEAETTSS